MNYLFRRSKNMFKKLAGIALAAMLIGSTAVVAGAAETDEVVGAADDSAVAAADDSSVGADDTSASTGADSKIYFDANSVDWKNYSKITVALYSKANGDIIGWGSKKGQMTDEGNGIWSLDVSSLGITNNCGCIFTADWGMQTCDLILGADSVGDTAQCTGEKVENNVDSNKSSYVVKWKSGKYGNPKCITSIGNVIGDYFWEGEDAISMFYTFISTDDAKSIKNATKYNNKNEQQTIDDTAKTLGLSFDQVKEQVAKAKAAGATLDWDESKSSLKSSDSSSSSSGSGSSGSSSSGSTTSGSSSSSSSSGSSSSTSTVTSGEGDTVYFIIGGVMLAALGVFFLARKRREF